MYFHCTRPHRQGWPWQIWMPPVQILIAFFITAIISMGFLMLLNSATMLPSLFTTGDQLSVSTGQTGTKTESLASLKWKRLSVQYLGRMAWSSDTNLSIFSIACRWRNGYRKKHFRWNRITWIHSSKTIRRWGGWISTPILEKLNTVAQPWHDIEISPSKGSLPM